jgi:hypothetical protein
LPVAAQVKVTFVPETALCETGWVVKAGAFKALTVSTAAADVTDPTLLATVTV